MLWVGQLELHWSTVVGIVHESPVVESECVLVHDRWRRTIPVHECSSLTAPRQLITIPDLVGINLRADLLFSLKRKAIQVVSHVDASGFVYDKM